MLYEDLDFPFEDFVEFVKNNNMAKSEYGLDYFITIHDLGENRLRIRPEYYYGDTILAFNIEITNAASEYSMHFRWEVLYS